MYLYFVASEVVSRVKIGFTNCLPKRLSHLRTGSPVPLYVLGVVWFDDRKKTEAEEERLHSRFDYSRVRGEWFELTPEVHDEIVEYIFKSESYRDSQVYEKTRFCRCGKPIGPDEGNFCCSCFLKLSTEEVLATIGFSRGSGPRCYPKPKTINSSEVKNIWISPRRCRCGGKRLKWRKTCDSCSDDRKARTAATIAAKRMAYVSSLTP